MIRVEGHNGFVRDEKTGAILNINSTEIEAARARKKAWRLEEEKKKQLEADVNDLKSEMSEIKGLLQQLVEKL